MVEDSERPWWSRRPWLAALLLYAPIAPLYLQPFLFHAAGNWPTGFFQYDQASYMAAAREYFDEGFGFLAGNPFSPDALTPRIFFQPWTFVLGCLWYVTNADPGRLYLVFGIASGIVMLRLTIALYLRLPQPARQPHGTLGLLLLCWGGGLFFLAGLGANIAQGGFLHPNAFRFDPADGLWFLNLGRNLFFSCEAFYHAAALGFLVALIDRRWIVASLLGLLLIASHPFTGTQILLVGLGWFVVERVLDRSAPPVLFGAALSLVLGAGLAYYLWFLPSQSAEHADVERFWREAASPPLETLSALLGWGPVTALALAGLWLHLTPFDRLQRLLWIMAVGSLLLTNHELFIEPHQPLHFTRGYVWTPLFLLGLPALQRALGWLGDRSRALVGIASALFLLDNASWLSIQFLNNVRGAGYQLELSDDERAAMDALRSPPVTACVLVTDRRVFAAVAMARTPLRAWASHIVSTPYVDARLAEVQAWHDHGVEPDEWTQRCVVFVRDLGGRSIEAFPWAAEAQSVQVFGTLAVVWRPPLHEAGES